jgi:hypothetical protein
MPPRRAKASRKQRDIPDELLPIVDAVVETVFARLSLAAAAAGKQPSRKKPGKPKSSTAKSPAAKKKTALAEALADLLLADLTRQAAPPAKIGRPSAKGAKRRARKG